MWIANYKPQVKETAAKTPVTKPKALTSFISQLGAASAARSGISSTDPLDMWLSGGLILEGSEPVDALQWWLQQKRGGNTYGGLLNMALDQHPWMWSVHSALAVTMSQAKGTA
ncbi:hypothetical protein PGTUg99_009292 [Puccinia graminis f. sp. tritici]|uniref:Uncharacterized protein n=1 Tax=Puccinia graminis f. sp. tritici TaxID=56615 RepID=A0A5B0LTG6_PUCGR|nr:hypothetical protein PGTUg99_009292 [Puccinia graminis f. sp. tritici]